MSGDDGRSEAIVWALLVSVAVHVAAMFFMKPQVMTHVAGAGARTRARGPMTVREPAPPPEAVRIDTIRDVFAERPEPEAAAEELAPEAESLAAVGEIPEAPPPDVEAFKPQIREMTVDNAPLLSEPISVAEGLSSFTSPAVVQDSFFRPPETVSAPPPAPADVSSIDESPMPAPDAGIEMPSVLTDETVPGEGFADPAGDKQKESTFKPVEEVMAEIDEKVVSDEKQAVRDLMDARKAATLDDFVSIAPASAMDKEGRWKYFSVKVMPRAALETVPKDVVILMDASGSIANDRLRSCRDAAKEILRSCMNSGDRFNLVAFRDRFSYAFRTWRECDKAGYAAAERWMDSLAAHGRTDVFKTISSVLTLPRDPKRPLIALVVTDGDANAGVRRTSQILSKFTALNDGLVSVYMYGVKESANRELIDVLTHGNRGESFIYEGERKYAGRSIEQLSERFRDPVLTDLRVIFTAECKAEAYPVRLKNLYKGEFVEIVGRVPSDVGEVAFSMRGLNGANAYEGFFKVDLANARYDENLARTFKNEEAIDAKLR